MKEYLNDKINHSVMKGTDLVEEFKKMSDQGLTECEIFEKLVDIDKDKMGGNKK